MAGSNDDATLDCILSDLKTQMQDVHKAQPASRGNCGACGRPITGNVVHAMGKAWHEEHFACVNCRVSLGTGDYFDPNGQPHCESCYQKLHVPTCAQCNQLITDRAVKAFGKAWHPHHFVCCKCQTPLENKQFFEESGQPYCDDDWNNSFAQVCCVCKGQIKGEVVEAGGKKFHMDHFKCFSCRKLLGGQTYYESNGEVYCEQDYYRQTGLICAQCGQKISGKSVSALEKKWHPEHFLCHNCHKPLANISFAVIDGMPHCSHCAERK